MNLTPMDDNLTLTLSPQLPEPKASCRKCFGRGYIGRNLRTGKNVPCACVTKKRGGP